MTAPASYTEAQRREAAEWFIVINAEDDPNPETLQTWLQWMDADAGNQRAFEAIAQAWHSTPRASAAAMPTKAELLADEYGPEQSVADWLADRKPAAVARGYAADVRPGRALRTRRWALAAASLAALSIGGFQMTRYLRTYRTQSDEFATRVGEQIEITLADGSAVWLGPQSKLLVNFSAAQRRLQLVRGEAYFSVKKDKAWPFVVHSEGGDITAVGTAFNVRDVDRDVTVAVSEGIVAVAPRDSGSALQTLRVASGQQLTFNAGAPVTALAIKASPAPGERARWRDGILVYRDEPLRSVISDVARYRTKPLEIRDPRVGDLRYSGVVYTKALDEWLAALPESFPVRVVSGEERQEILSR
jgi:transmembrane sensor